MSQLFILDNLDSFTYNLVDEFKRLGYDPIIYRNTLPAQYIFEAMQQQDDEVILVLSPGPGSPSDAGCLMALIALCHGHYPMLGICLGHQALIQYFGGRIGRAGDVVHGKASLITHTETGPFAQLPQPLHVARYHSLVAQSMPSELQTLATYNDVVMAAGSDSERVLGLQFHPESILTSNGSQLLEQCLHYLSTCSMAVDNTCYGSTSTTRTAGKKG
ncbi:aminodeoxychorismate/anthranilate synthase component II [Thalassotalea ponticola]|uniref:aminodeoxychorismate/anthranilate synthase component II n=1 Tax=Thalassotalea ponticola TaxID=1523392 RepID=UPI0025B2CC9B|nr:aminodeoxychorismate/anthranilate synthase component II [Thalassotalea ponticola]MDN3653199.1 aminodeoxychorismate/anthranilate synthase component II [Thalassotalea ponticola]